MNSPFKSQIRFDFRYRSAIAVSAVFQLLSLGVGVLAFDGGLILRVTAVSLIAFWILTIVIAIRRPMAPTKVDLNVIRYGFPAIVCALYVVTNVLVSGPGKWASI